MAGAIEGIGDEVIWFIIAVIVVILISLAWISTHLPPVDYYVWLVQMQIHPNRRVIQVLQVDNQEINLLHNQPERPQSSAVTEETLEALMDDGIIEQSNPSNEAVPSRSENIDINNWEELQNDQNMDKNAVNLYDIFILLKNVACSMVMISVFEVQQQATDHEQNVLSVSDTSGTRDQHSESLSTSAPNARLCYLQTSAEKDSENGSRHELSAVISDSAYQFDEKEKGTERRQLSSVKLKFLDDSQVTACTELESTVGQFKRRYFWDSIHAGKAVRLIYRGQLLRDDTRSLLSYGLHDQCVVHCHVSTTPYAQPSAFSSALSSTFSHENDDINSGTAAAAIAAIAGTQSIATTAAGGDFTRRIVQTFRGHSIEDNHSDSMVLRIRNAFLRASRYIYNMVMGPVPMTVTVENQSLDAAADAATHMRWNQNILGNSIGQYVYIIFIVKFLILWTCMFLFPQYADRFSLLLLTFLSLFFLSIMFANSRGNNDGIQT
ncbi:unnamed protein product [Thelazia callipaeda]|uniref:Ubiquitin-like domain-containing protein n=1 Tax=Thelazia callipaeda TaxID=103827 RepID=A0A158RCV1_THECL|nr:unnamed protein product [Thelazia callipaeda]